MNAYLVTIGTLLLVAIVAGSIAQIRTATKHTQTLGQIHTLVNSRLTEALDDITALKKALVDERRHSGKGKG